VKRGVAQPVPEAGEKLIRLTAVQAENIGFFIAGAARDIGTIAAQRRY
jgi:hypothetical protein